MKKNNNIDEHMTTQDQTDAIIKLLTNSGVIKDKSIKDKQKRDAAQKKRLQAYHNTELLLKNYRTIAWLVECFPETIEEELEERFGEVDDLAEKLDLEMALGNKRLENRLEGVSKNRLVLDRINEALTVLKKMPGDNERLYNIIYYTYITDEKLTQTDLLYRLDISARHYYRLKEQAINIISLRLWSSPSSNLDKWLEMLAILGG